MRKGHVSNLGGGRRSVHKRTSVAYTGDGAVQYIDKDLKYLLLMPDDLPRYFG